MNSFLVLACLAALALANAQTDYCKLNCGDMEHVACEDPKREYEVRCLDSVTAGNDFSDNATMIDLILKYHNNLRNKIAGGEGGRYPMAKRMLTMQWDPELAFMASLISCSGEGYKCFRTPRYDSPGQNTHISWPTKTEEEAGLEYAVLKVLKIWEDTYLNAENPRADIASYPSSYGNADNLEIPGEQSARMCIDRSPVVGCAYSKSSAGSDHSKFVLVCHYGFDLVAEKPIYVEGAKPAEGCTRPNKNYENLCCKYDTDRAISSLAA